MSPRPIKRSSFVEEAYRAIRQRIVGGDFAPGTPLNIDALARELGVSNSPIREALRRLENERWVETIPYRGAFVRPFDPGELAEVYELREMLELAAMSKVMPKPPAESVKQLSKILADIRKSLREGDPMGYLTADTRFHQCIVDMAGNRRLSEMYAMLVEQGKCFLLGRSRESISRYRKGRDQHGDLYAAIRDGDLKEASLILESHLRLSLDAARKSANENQETKG